MIRYLFLVSCLLYGMIARGQVPVGDFSASVTSGCSPVVVYFKDLSTGNPKFWNWDLGNGQLSNQQNPVGIYSAPGKYSVTLVVRNANGTDGITKKDLIVVNPSPQASFTSDFTLVCTPTVVSFKDLSVPNAGVITKWEWNFGDGSTSTLQHPQKTYTATGYYTVNLKVTSSTGCTSTLTSARYIRVVAGIKAAFIDSISPVCQTPVPVRFINETSGPGQLSYSWNLGNGNTSTAPQPVESYSNAGNYTIRLIASSNLGCKDTAEASITINNKVTSFNSPDTACIGQPVTFRNNNNAALTNNWDFGDSTSSTQSTAVKTYASPGIYTVTLLNRYSDCTDSAKKTITVLDLPVVAFNSDNQSSCKSPFSVNFQDNSADAIAWSWNFGDGSTGTGKNITHTYTSAGQFDVTLTVTSKYGCQNSLKKTAYIKIVPPTVSIANAPAGACIPFTYTPIAIVNSIDGVNGYLWDFGNGSTNTSPNPSNIYSAVGNYTLKLTVSTNGGCTASVNIPNGIKTGTPPTVDFSTGSTVTCAFDSIQFTDLTNIADEWLWEFGDGNTSRLRNPKHAFDTTGSLNVKLTASNNGCPISVTKTAFVTITPPIPGFIYKSNCNNRLSVDFINGSIVDTTAPVSYLWEFGDAANTRSTAKDTSFNYSNIGVYNVKLTVVNGTCTNTITRQITLVSDLADFSSPKTNLCKNEKITFTAINSQAANITGYLWTINGNAQTGGRSIETAFPAPGKYDISLQITDLNGCTDTKTKTGYITVTGPQAAFTSSAINSCVNSAVTFTDASTPAGNISKWTFIFGDGSSQSFNNPPFTHAFKDTGNFQVLLTVQDKQGCTDVSSIPGIAVTKPSAGFVAEETRVCPGMEVRFIDSSSGYSLSYLWDFGDGATSTDKAPSHIYPAGDKVYTVKLKVIDISGCVDSMIRTNYIIVRSPKSAFTVTDTVTMCPPLETKFFFKGADYESYYWDFGDDGTSLLENPTHFYNSYGSFTAKLYVVGYGGCIDSSEHQVNVYDPYSSTIVKYNPLDACNALLVDFSITTPPATRFQLIFGDGGSDSSQNKTLRHHYVSPSFYQPYILLEDALDCQVAIGGTETIRVIGAEPFFSVDKKNFCDSGTVYFTNYTIGNDPVVSDTWDFGDGQTSAVRDPVHTYSLPGLYVVSHIVQTESGCSKTITDTIRVYRTPDPTILSKDVICINTQELIKGVLPVADTAIKWNWTLGNGQVSTLENVNQVYNKEGDYTIAVEATNLLGCKGNDTKLVRVAPLPVITVAENPVISLGSSIKLPVTYSQNIMSYNWAPANAFDCASCPNPLVTPKFTTTYKINVIDSNNCKSASEITVSVICNEKNYFVPNTFSPNGDGVNDVFYPRGAGIDKIQSMRIFNRWGELVFEKRNFSVNSQANGWNGTHRGKQANSDVYVYIIEFICENAIIVTYKGNIALIR